MMKRVAFLVLAALVVALLMSALPGAVSAADPTPPGCEWVYKTHSFLGLTWDTYSLVCPTSSTPQPWCTTHPQDADCRAPATPRPQPTLGVCGTTRYKVVAGDTLLLLGILCSE